LELTCPLFGDRSQLPDTRP